MTDIQRVTGGLPTPAGGIVSADQVTIQGDGASHPLHAVDGAIAVVADDITIGGDGTSDDPLHLLSTLGPPTAVAFFDASGKLIGDPISLSWDAVAKNLLIGGAPAASHLFINQTQTDHGSAADVQVSSLVASAAQLRCNQYGNHTGVPGVSSLKSRGTAIGQLASVVVGDVLWRATAVGVPADNVSIPLAGLISIIADLVGSNYVATSFEIQLVPLAGPINGRKQAFRVDSEGILHVTESPNKMAGVAVLDAAGTALVANTRVTATTKFLLTAQDGGALLTGSLQQSARVPGASFTIRSSAGAGDAGVRVYYQLWEPTVP